MNPALSHQLAHLDRALLLLLDERARLLATLPEPAARPRAALEDLLRRHRGPFAAEALPDLYAVIDRGCGVERPAGEAES